MPFIPDAASHRVLFATHFWIDRSDHQGSESSYSSVEEAQAEFERVEASGRFKLGGLYKWNHAKDDWDCLDAFPETFDGVN